MSGLMFEGDTIERFGKLFPKPFIQQIRVFDDLIEADVALFFEVSLDDDETDEIIQVLNNNLRIYGAFLEQAQFDRTIDPNSTDSFFGNSFFTLYFNNNDFKRTAPLDNIQYHFNSEGKKFAKALVTFEYVGWSTDGYGDLSSNRYFASFTSFDSPGSITGTENESIALSNLLSYEPNKEVLYKNQTSDLVYEKIFNPNGTLNVGPQNVFRESSGLAFEKTPIQTLGKTYKKSNQVTHQSIVDYINPIISPFIGSASEADMISMTLSNFANDPEILTQLQKNINSFSNKSSTTAVGRLYSELVDAVTDIDNLLQPEESLDKRLETSTKVVDKRGDQTLIRGSIDASLTEHLSQQNIDNEIDNYIYPFILQTTRNYYYDVEGGKTAIELFESGQTSDGREEVYVYKTTGFIFIDYEKLLNYTPSISRFFNTYSLEQIFGKNCLNSYYKISQYKLSKKHVEYDGSNPADSVFDYLDSNLEMVIDGTSSRYGTCEIKVKKSEGQFAAVNSLIGASSATIGLGREYSYLRILPFQHIRNGRNYKLMALEFVDFNRVDLLSQIRYFMEIQFTDTTYQFYDIFIRQKVFDAFEKLEEYYNFANQFCSYNNLDNRFNDFFVDAISSQFEEPYPWEEAPLIYHSMRALLETSYDLRGTQAEYIELNRRKDGSLIDMNILKNQAILDSKSISPATGDLNSLEDFYNKFQTLREIFIKGQGLDNGGIIYDPDQEGYELRTPNVNTGIIKEQDYIQDYDLEIFSV